MATYNPVSGWIIDSLLANTSINATVQGRIYTANIHTLPPNPTYPLITIERSEPGFYDPNISFELYPISITVYSTVSTDECYRIMSYITPLLRNETDGNNSFRWVIRPISSPYDDFDEKGERILLVSQDFIVQQIG